MGRYSEAHAVHDCSLKFFFALTALHLKFMTLYTLLGMRTIQAILMQWRKHYISVAFYVQNFDQIENNC